MAFFKNLKILELASVLAGPAVGQFFAELGSLVIKVENVSTRGDVTRNWKLSTEDPETDISAYFSSVNWGKYSIALDLKQPEALEIVYGLIPSIDVVIANFKPGDAEKLRVDYPTLKRLNPRLIYGQITGYGSANPRAGFDAIIQAEAGFTYMNGEPESLPTKMPVALMDVLAAHQLKEAILVALIEREFSGEGCMVEAPLFQSGVASLVNQATNWLVGNTIPQRLGSDHPNIVPYGTLFLTRDNHYIVLAVGTEKQFRELCTILGLKELPSDPRFDTNHNRVRHREELKRLLQEKIKKFDRDELLRILHRHNVPAGGVFNMQEVFEQPEAREMIIEGKTTDKRIIRGVKSIAFRMGNFHGEVPLTPPPHYGEHSTVILKKYAGLSEERIQQLKMKGVVDGQ